MSKIIREAQKIPKQQHKNSYDQLMRTSKRKHKLNRDYYYQGSISTILETLNVALNPVTG